LMEGGYAHHRPMPIMGRPWFMKQMVADKMGQHYIQHGKTASYRGLFWSV
jgi:hypothetical protein